MQLTALGRRLYEAIAELTVVDAHEHLPPERDYLAFEYCGPNMFAGGYLWHDLESAGMPTAFKLTLRDGGYRPVDAWWPQIRPFWPYVQHSSYARALRITLRDLWGIAEINDQTIHPLAERVMDDNRPGLYQRVLAQRCKIRRALTNIIQPVAKTDPILRGVPAIDKHFALHGALFGRSSAGRDRLDSLEQLGGRPIRTLDDAVEITQSLLRADLAAGAVALKLFITDYQPPDARMAEREFQEARRHAPEPGYFPALRDYLIDKGLDVAAEAGVPVATHAGYFGDFREVDVTYMFNVVMRRRDVQFDLFHLGVPMWREAALIGKTQPNVTLNLTWCPIVSQTTTVRTLDEIIDLVPMNKIIAFGADYRVAVHKVYGHLVMAREVVAAALAKRIEAGEFDAEYALHLAGLWLHDNAARVYRV